MGFLNTEQQKDLLHYALVYSAILIAWPWSMTQMQNNLYFTAAVVFGVFVLTDKLVHGVLKV